MSRQSKPVVLGVLIAKGRVLLGQRRRDGALPWKWGCPGGKVEDGETDAGALAREWLEELGIHVQVGPLVTECTLIPPDGAPYTVKHYRVYPFFDVVKPMPIVEEGIGWFTVDEIWRLGLIGAIVPSLNSETISMFDRVIACLTSEGL